MKMCQCKDLNAVIAGPDELAFFNDAWIKAKDLNERKANNGRQKIEKNKTMSDEKFENQNKFNEYHELATEYSFDFESKMWENGAEKYSHQDLQFVSSVQIIGIKQGSDQECRQNLKDVIGFYRGWKNEEQLSMHFLSSDETDGCKLITASTRKPGGYTCSSKDNPSRLSRNIINEGSEYR